ncbi:MAG: hypothetical protein COS90_02935 [Deltaproteobacteria bacterium CG07_land_8_20_14_0_80_60_11]|nr:MAG: hypothetical protein COS90_02935 [Deltaproteobacteria bacterium CG07_land_8_20_14_0_80_60_11]
MPAPQAHQALMEEIARLEELAREWIELFPQAGLQGQHWQKVLSQVQAHAAEDTCRLAVVGAVKSGKSTMINALVGQDLLRRGAGILTAMVTRVQPGPESRAVLRFKGWDEINGEIRRALGLLPNPRLVDRAAPLDLKEAPDRELLAQVLAEAREADLWTGGSLDQNYLLLKSYLEGYDLLQGFMPATGVLPLTGPDLARHRDLVTREATAVYLKDVLLTIPFPWPATGVELGDCQGSDSPFPQHLAQVLAYLIKSDLALYVVSSRVGLRQADFQFLAELKRMGLMPHILALLNLDLGEHTSYVEVVKIRDRVAQELSSWQPDPRVYAFSALKLLLDRRQARGESLDPREAAVLEVWATDPDSAAFSEAEAARFEEDLKAALGDLRARRLAGGSLAQVRMVARGLREQLELTDDLLTRGMDAIKELEDRLSARRQPLHATLATVSQTLEGAGNRLKKTLRSRVDRLLDRHSGQVGKDLSEFIQDFAPDWDQLAPPSVTPAFRPVLYQLFQEFAQALAHHVTNEVNLTLVEFIREQEEWLRQELARLWQPLFLTLQEALALYYREIADLGLAAAAPTLETGSVARPQGLELPLLNLEVAPDWRFAREVWVASGMGVLGRTWDALKRRLRLAGEVEPRRQLLRDLARALAALKAWLGSELESQLLNYREGLKFQYFLPLVDQWLKQQEISLADTLGSLLGSLQGAAETMHLAEAERADRRRRLDQLIPLARRIEARLEAGERQQ